MFYAFAQFCLGRPSLGQVARDFGEADKGPLGRAYRVNDDMGPEVRAILADAPTFALEATRALSLRQRLSGNVLRPLSLGVEGREMAPDNLSSAS